MLHTERDELYNKFESTIYDVQQKSGFKNLLLEKKLEALTEVRARRPPPERRERRCACAPAQAMEKKEAQFNEVLAASNIDPTMLGNITRKLDDVMEHKNKVVKGLQVRCTGVHYVALCCVRPRMCHSAVGGGGI
jgi:hypothetical protein